MQVKLSRRYLARKALQVIPAVVGVLTINFAILHAAPGDIADVLAGEAGAATPEYMVQLRAQFGLDQSLFAQYLRYLLNVATGDLGYSYRYNTPVSQLIMGHLPVTLILMGFALAIAVAVGVLLGAIAARYVDTPVDWSITALSLIAYSVPGFWLGLMMIVLFSVHLDWLPSSGFETIGVDSGFIETGFDIVRHLMMPSLALAAFYLAVYTRLMRASMIEIYEMDFVRTAVAKGVSPVAITFRHVLPNALIPVVTMAALHIGSLIGGAVVVEQVFNLPGIGTLAFEAIFQRDYNLLLGVLLFSSLLVIVVNFALDVVYTFIDPRIELA
jgi:peptide/nickel transport system permease protein